MYRTPLAILSAVTIVWLGTPAAATDVFRPYVGLYGGASFLEDADNEGAPFAAGYPRTSIRSQFDTGFLVGGTLGVAVQSWLNTRLELDLSYRGHELDDLRVRRDGGLGDLAGVGSLDGTSARGLGLGLDGDVGIFAALVNYWIDIPTGTTLTPYLGGGLGVARVDAKDIRIEGTEIVDDGDTVFAWQLGAGLDLALTRNWSLNAGYRWFNTSDPELELTPTGQKFESEIMSHSVLGGLRFTF